jgi:translation initiation factor 2 beta subunit (eIF-2beta)/eIF-5
MRKWFVRMDLLRISTLSFSLEHSIRNSSLSVFLNIFRIWCDPLLQGVEQWVRRPTWSEDSTPDTRRIYTNNLAYEDVLLRCQESLQGGQYGPFTEAQYDTAKLLILELQTLSEKECNLIIKHSTKRAGDDSSVKNLQQLYTILDSLALAPDFHVAKIPFTGYVRNHEIIRGMDSVPLLMRSPVECLMYLLSKPEFKGNMDFAAKPVYDDQQQRIFAELSSGEWFQRTELLIPVGGTLLPVVLYTDKTRLSVFGSVSAYPLYMTIASLHRSVRKDDESRILVALFPIVACPPGVSKAELSSLNHWMFHKALDMVFFRIASPFADHQTEGMTYGHTEEFGLYATGPDGKIRKYFPRLAYYVADWPEAKLVTSTRGGKSEYPCHRCYVKGSDMSDVSTEALANLDMRTADHFFEIVQECEGMNKGATERHLKQWSIKATICTPLQFRDFDPFSNGVVVERMHQADNGLFKHMVKWLLKYIEVNGANDGAAVQQRLVHRLTNIPSFQGIRNFPNGVDLGPNATAGEYRDLAKVLLFCLPGLFGEPALDQPLVQVFRAYCHWYALLRKPGKTEHELGELGRLYAEFGSACGSVFKLEIYSRTKLNFPKFHQPAHYARDIRNYGDYDSAERYEYDHKGLKSMWKYHSNKQGGGVAMEQVCRYMNRVENMALLCHHADTFSQALNDDDDDVVSEVVAAKTLTAHFLGKPTRLHLQTAAGDEAVLSKYPWLPRLAASLAEKGVMDAVRTQVSLHNSVRLFITGQECDFLRVVASSTWQNGPGRHDNVCVQASEGEWYGQVLAVFTCRSGDETGAYVFVRWYWNDVPFCKDTGMPRMFHKSREGVEAYDVTPVQTLLRRVYVIPRDTPEAGRPKALQKRGAEYLVNTLATQW